MIDMDMAASAPVSRTVLEAMWPYLVGGHANPASVHDAGKSMATVLRNARMSCAAALGARENEIVFTSGGTEAINMAIKGIAFAEPRGRHIIISAAEHSAVTQSAQAMERYGYEITVLPITSTGLITYESLAENLRPDTTVVSLQYANNEVGTIQPITALSELTREMGVPFHLDAVQAAPWLNLDVAALGVDAMSVAGHKLGTPKGTGLLYLNRKVACEPLIHGGGHQNGLRSGTESVAGAVGMAAALAQRPGSSPELAAARDAFIAQVENTIPHAICTGERQQRLPGLASFIIEGRSGESMVIDMSRHGIMCSSRSACGGHENEPSPALVAMGFSPDQADGALRFSFDADAAAHLDEVAETLARICR